MTTAFTSVFAVCSDAAGIAVNLIGAVFQLIYISIFILYAERPKKIKMSGLLIAVLALFAIIVFLSTRVLHPSIRQIFVGYLSVASLISMFASPLFIIVLQSVSSTHVVFCMDIVFQKLVIKTRSVEFMPFYLSLSTFLMSLSFSAYGMSKYDPFIYVPNGIGTILGLVQLALYYYISTTSTEESRQPLIDTYV
ncbi:SWEET sugar transporter [Parasponia andersonii]|uniref:SWEET sugar transporter n=1 Tax=Parasponia andersonii TaxID=3476 RepID=A0A2P5C0R4_PARAD|nr:SWEET sugar transporter [Parasponia andersonii]